MLWTTRRPILPGRNHGLTFAAKAATGWEAGAFQDSRISEKLGCSVAYKFLLTESHLEAFLGAAWGGYRILSIFNRISIQKLGISIQGALKTVQF